MYQVTIQIAGKPYNFKYSFEDYGANTIFIVENVNKALLPYLSLRFTMIYRGTFPSWGTGDNPRMKEIDFPKSRVDTVKLEIAKAIEKDMEEKKPGSFDGLIHQEEEPFTFVLQTKTLL